MFLPSITDHHYEDIVIELLSVEENDNNNENDKEMTCFICLEHKDETGIVSLQKAYLYQNRFARCGCKEWVHQNCLEKWYHNHSKKCIMCNTNFYPEHPMPNRALPLFFVLIMQLFLYFLCVYSFLFIIIMYVYFIYVIF